MFQNKIKMFTPAVIYKKFDFLLKLDVYNTLAQQCSIHNEHVNFFKTVILF